MLVLLIFNAIAIAGTTLAIGWPLAHRLRLSPSEKVATVFGLSLVGVYLFAWALYVCDLPPSGLYLLPIFAALLLAHYRASLAATWRDPVARELLLAQACVSLWCVGLLALVRSYSGGTWVADWFGHWQRAVFFLERGPPDALFNGFNALPSRPPLANILFGAFLHDAPSDFARYQLITTLLSSLVFGPAALLARCFRGAPATWTLAALFMLNPLFAQNATFAPMATKSARVFVSAMLAAIVVLGVAVHSRPDPWGLAHICLQSLVLVGLAYLAARWPTLGPLWRRVLIAGATIDSALGIALHFAVQNIAAPAQNYATTAVINWNAKAWHNWTFFGDTAVHAFALARPSVSVKAPHDAHV